MNTQIPKVSVIIPVYNTAPYLRECMDSVVNQTLRDIEIICVDDGSTDGSLAILREYEKKDSRIRVLTQPNINAGAARNLGLCYATGEFLSFLDSDDYIEPAMLMDCCRIMEDRNADIVCFSANLLEMRTGTIEKIPWSLVTENLPDTPVFSPLEIKDRLFNTFQNWPWNKLFRRALIEKNQIRFQEIPRTNDMLFTCSALALAERITTIDHAYVVYRVGTGTSLQQTNHNAPLSFWDAYTETKSFLTSSGLYDQFEKSFLNWVLDGVIYNYHSMKEAAAGTAVFFKIKYCGERDFHFLDHPETSYSDEKTIQEYVSILKQEYSDSDYYKKIIERQNALQNDLDHIHSSLSYRIGRTITWLPRKIRGGVRCYQEHGLRYTAQRVVYHLTGQAEE